jgi:hypothetical protein
MSGVYTLDDFPDLPIEIAKIRVEQANINWEHRLDVAYEKSPSRSYKSAIPNSGIPNNNARIIAKYGGKKT